MRFNAYRAMGDAELAKREVDALLEHDIPERMRLEALLGAFELYIELSRRDKARRTLERIDACGDAEASASAHLLYDVVIDGSTARIGELERALEGSEGVRRMQLLYLLSIAHDNAGDRAAAERLLRESRSMLDGVSGRG